MIRTAPSRSPAPGLAALALIGLAFAVPASGGESEAEAVPDRIVVLKSERKLVLYAGETVLRSMDIALGLMPEGPKQREGDYRTPEGSYFIEEKKSDSDFFLALRVSYPNAADVAHARSLGVDPGGEIMIHGLPNAPKRSEASYQGVDWTDGCIAVSNSDMIDLWRLISVSTPIEIRP